MLFTKTRVLNHEMGFKFIDGDFTELLKPGCYWFIKNPFRRVTVDIVSQRAPWIQHKDLDVILRSGALDGSTAVFDIKDSERGLVWVDGHYQGILGPGLHAAWTTICDVRVEIVPVSAGEFTHPNMVTILSHASASKDLVLVNVQPGHKSVVTQDNQLLGVYDSGRYVFWRAAGNIAHTSVDARQVLVEVNGQELMTADKVTLRMNVTVTYQVQDVLKAVTSVESFQLAVYRDVQLALRALVSGRDLDTLLAAKDALGQEMADMVRARIAEYGVSLISVGIRDIILPGDMKELMNKVIEAKKAAQANLIARQEETAAMRSQANTAKLIESNPTLMRLRELEILEKIATNNKISVVVSEKGLSSQFTNLI